MQLKMSTDYAIRIILYLAKMKKVNTQQLSNELNISQNYVRKLIRQPEMTSFIISEPGVNGGLALKKEATDISLLDIVKAIEKSTFINYCLEDEESCERCKSFEKQQCPIRACYMQIQKNLEEELKAPMIASLIEEEE